MGSVASILSRPAVGETHSTRSGRSAGSKTESFDWYGIWMYSRGKLHRRSASVVDRSFRIGREVEIVMEGRNRLQLDGYGSDGRAEVDILGVRHRSPLWVTVEGAALIEKFYLTPRVMVLTKPVAVRLTPAGEPATVMIWAPREAPVFDALWQRQLLAEVEFHRVQPVPVPAGFRRPVGRPQRVDPDFVCGRINGQWRRFGNLTTVQFRLEWPAVFGYTRKYKPCRV